jgi:1-acyl-sn-glycerol-3-phosphate acyltransferase
MADAQGGAREGLAWLGRVPESRATPLVRALRVFARFVCFGLLRFEIRTSGQEHIPNGGYLLVAAAHRGWMEPRAWFLGSGPSTFTSRSRERLVHRLGGLLPVWRGGVKIDQHVESARAVVGNGGVFVQMPEGTVSGPAGTTGPFRIGWAVIALRTGAPIVPMAIAGTEELYIGRRMASRVLAARTAGELVPDWDGVVPEAGSKGELELARRMTAALDAVLRPVVEELHPWTIDPPGPRRLLRDRLTWLLLRPGRVDRA